MWREDQRFKPDPLYSRTLSLELNLDAPCSRAWRGRSARTTGSLLSDSGKAVLRTSTRRQMLATSGNVARLKLTIDGEDFPAATTVRC